MDPKVAFWTQFKAISPSEAERSKAKKSSAAQRSAAQRNAKRSKDDFHRQQGSSHHGKGGVATDASETSDSRQGTPSTIPSRALAVALTSGTVAGAVAGAVAGPWSFTYSRVEEEGSARNRFGCLHLPTDYLVGTGYNMHTPPTSAASENYYSGDQRP